VATAGALLIVGCPGYSTTAAETPGPGATSGAGCVYVLVGLSDGSGQWRIDDMLFAPDATAAGRFGSSVATEGDTIVVGAGGTGKSYVFKRNPDEYTDFVFSMDHTDPNGPDEFASTQVAVTEGAVLVADKGDDLGGLTNQGAVYLYEAPTTTQSDTCTGAWVIPLNQETQSHYGCTSLATASGFAASSCGNGGTGPDAWYSWTPTCNGNVIIDTYGSEFDTVLSVHTGCPVAGNLQQVACNDDGFPAPERDSLVTFNFAAGTTYYIRVAGYNAASGAFTLRTVPIYGSYPNETCATAADIVAMDTVVVNCGADTDAPVPPHMPMHNDLWYRYTAPASGDVIFDTCSNNFDTTMIIYPGDGACPGSGFGAQLSQDDDDCGPQAGSRITQRVMVGQSYLIRIGAFYAGRYGTCTLHVGDVFTCDADFTCDGNVDQDDVACIIGVVAGNPGCECQDPDFNSDGNVDQDDVAALIEVIAGGNCP
jgi:hypothetical protein